MSRNRIGLLTVVALIGVGLAACLGVLTAPTSGSDRAALLASYSSEPCNPPCEAEAACGPPHSAENAVRLPREETEPAPVAPKRRPKSRDLAEVLGASRPVWAAPHPSITYQIEAPQNDSALMDLLGALRERLDADAEGSQADSAREPGDASDAAPLPPPESPPAPAPEPDSTPSEPPPAPKPAGTVDDLGNQRFEIHFQESDLRLVLEAISEHAGLNVIVSDSVQGTVTANFVDVDAMEALDAILKSTGFLARREGQFVYVGAPEDFEAMEKTLDQIETRIYRPQYITAMELQTLITPLVSEQVGFLSVSSAAEVGIATDESNAGGDSYAGEEVLLVRDYAAVLSEIDQIVAEVDIRPLQVAIEAMILSIKLDDETKMGVSFEFLRDHPNVRFGLGSPLNALPAKLDKGGLQFAFLDSNLGAFVDALESIQDTNVIATPRVLVLNKHRAEVHIGKKEGYISSTITETSTSQSVDFLDTGTILRIRPFISPDGLVRMELHPELSTGEVQISQEFTIPKSEVTQVTTNVMVRDGCTVIIGGLIREQLSSGKEQLPLLGSLPLVGPVFRSKQNQSTVREEILILLTPHILRAEEACGEGSQAACEFHRRRDVMAEKQTCLSRDHMSRRYFRLAQNAWARGDRERALKYAELAVHFSPGNRAAIDLRSDIWMNEPHGGHTLIEPGVLTEPGEEELDGEPLPPWVLKELEAKTNEPPLPAASTDGGTISKSINKPGGWR